MSPTDTSTLNRLELPEVLRRAAALAAFAPSRSRILELTPSSDRKEVRARLHRVSEAHRLLALEPTFTVGPARDVALAAAAAARGQRLEIPDILKIADQLRSVQRTRQAVAKYREELTDLWTVASPLAPLPAIQAAIAQALDDEGHVLDSASIALGDIRRQLRRTRAEVERLIQRVIHSAEIQRALQEPIVTERNGRTVVPVKVEHRAAFAGIVHDASASGATIFMEPMALVGPNNRVRELEAAESHEIERVLLELSGVIGAEHGAVVTGLDGVATIDAAVSVAHYADELRAMIPAIRDDDGFDLRAARHPLLTGDVVPLTIAMPTSAPDGYRAVVITGPNTGGKTVALKTVGLLHAMAACGIPIPADEGSSVAVYRTVMADIGDEQSIAQSLSTFSSHMRNLVAMVDAAGPGTLVLTDELGAGTDPTEGAALAQAILQRLLDAGAVSVITTHHPELKTFAAECPLARNASMEFDLETLRPTYRLRIGLPGQSNALAIAEKLGLNPEVVDDARRRLASQHRDMEAAIARLSAEGLAAERAREQAEGDARGAAASRDKLDDEITKLSEEREEVLRAARREARELVQLARVALRDAGEASRPGRGRTPDEARARVRQVEGRLERAQPGMSTVAPEHEPSELAVGDRVMVLSLNREAEVRAVDGDGVDLTMGAVRTRVSRNDLRRIGGPMKLAARRRRLEYQATSVPAEIDIRGMRASEAEAAVDAGVNEAFLRGSDTLRVIHGKGTGVLRQVVREYLRTHPAARTMADAAGNEGGDGVTVVTLAGTTATNA